ncbi:Carbonic anhydrase 5B, mitochondrial [Myotis brandtii]|uniref:Carbonic anhydrase 5B, mitochondrial n=1 Tax=Myotis brandtii TaxID=109478 RepID=S7MK25_MYOBR|nr:Carbonic anhydrase 5B, mitochondrial [Myotis brandtii]
MPGTLPLICPCTSLRAGTVLGYVGNGKPFSYVGLSFTQVPTSSLQTAQDFKPKIVVMSSLRVILQASLCKSLWRRCQILRSMPVRPCSLYTCSYKTRNRAYYDAFGLSEIRRWTERLQFDKTSEAAPLQRAL